MFEFFYYTSMKNLIDALSRRLDYVEEDEG